MELTNNALSGDADAIKQLAVSQHDDKTTPLIAATTTPEESDDFLLGFLNEVEDIVQRGEEKPKSKIDHQAETLNWTKENQLDHLLQKHSKFLNLNPYHVFGFRLETSSDVNDEDVKKRYHKLSSLLHPDKNFDARAPDAFEVLTKAHHELKERRDFYMELFDVCRKTSDAARILRLQSEYRDNLAAFDANEPTFLEAHEKEIKRVLATMEHDRVRSEQIRSANEAAIAQSKKKVEPNWAEFKKTEDEIKATADERVKNWSEFAGAKRRKME